MTCTSTRVDEPPPNRQLAMEYIHRDRLRLNPKNPNRHSRKAILKLAESMKALGMNVPVLADGELMVLAGEARLKACRELGVAMVPVIRLEHLTSEEAELFMIAENRFGQLSEIDPKALARLFTDLSVLNLSLELTGFETAEIDLMIEELDLRVGEAEDLPSELPTGPAVSRLGDVWVCHNPRSSLEHLVCCADALAASSYQGLMAGELAAAVITDPPFGNPVSSYLTGQGKTRHREFVQGSEGRSPEELESFLGAACLQLAAHARPGALVYIFMDWRGIEVLLRVGRQAFDELKNLIVWAKTAPGMGALYRSQHELAALFKVKGAAHRNNIQLGRFGRSRSNLWTYAGMTSPAGRRTDEGDLLAMHPTVKPAIMIGDAILDCTARGEIVLDPFLGSGTCLVSAERTGRRCRGLELDPLYVDCAIQRWQRLSGEAAVLRGTGESFDQVAALRSEAGR